MHFQNGDKSKKKKSKKKEHAKIVKKRQRDEIKRGEPTIKKQ